MAVTVLNLASLRGLSRCCRAAYHTLNLAMLSFDLEARLFERWLPATDRLELLTESITWMPAGAASALVRELTPMFDEALGPL